MSNTFVRVSANIFNLAVGFLLLAAGGLMCWNATVVGIQAGFRPFIVGVVVGTFGLLLVIIEVWIPRFIRKYAGFLVTYFGRGLWLVFLGALVLGPPSTEGLELFFFASGIVIMVIGVIFMVLYVVDLLDRPKPLLKHYDADSLTDFESQHLPGSHY